MLLPVPFGIVTQSTVKDVGSTEEFVADITNGRFIGAGTILLDAALGFGVAPITTEEGAAGDGDPACN